LVLKLMAQENHHPYSLLARFYDRLLPQIPRMNRHARRKILGGILPRVGSVCELGCGTGETSLDFARRGLRVFAVDNSPAMCRQTRQKARRARLPVRVRCADMRSFRLPEPVDLVTSEFAALNHVRRTDLRPVLRAVARALRPGGYFYFDVNTPRAFAQAQGLIDWTEKDDFALLLRGRTDARRGITWLDFDWFLPAGKRWLWQREHVPHVCWTDAEIRRALRAAGFKRIRSWDGIRVRPAWIKPRAEHDTYYLAQKPNKKARRL
jgi:SAM-dependent methyltransferase